MILVKSKTAVIVNNNYIKTPLISYMIILKCTVALFFSAVSVTPNRNTAHHICARYRVVQKTDTRETAWVSAFLTTLYSIMMCCGTINFSPHTSAFHQHWHWISQGT